MAGKRRKKDVDAFMEAVTPAEGQIQAAAKLPETPGANASSLTRYQKFTMVKVHRSQLKNAPYNPRTMTDKARTKLKTNIGRVGLLEPIIWNKLTGNIVGGHQRLAVLDSLEKTDDYYLEVAQVELDDKSEREQNIFLNNGEAQGDWDMEKLEKLYKEDKIDFDNSGFDTADIYQLFGDSPLIEQPEKIQAIADKVRQARELYDKTVAKAADRDDVDFYIVGVFKNREDRKTFLDALGLEENRYVDGRFLTAKLGGA